MMKVPEDARATTHPILRSSAADGNNGYFVLPSPEPGWQLLIIASDATDPDAEGWEPVSVHSTNEKGKSRTPTWREMVFVKETFWDPEDVVMQLHPRRSVYVNLHPYTLHLWRSVTQPIPEPPAILVGPIV